MSICIRIYKHTHTRRRISLFHCRLRPVYSDTTLLNSKCPTRRHNRHWVELHRYKRAFRKHWWTEICYRPDALLSNLDKSVLHSYHYLVFCSFKFCSVFVEIISFARWYDIKCWTVLQTGTKKSPSAQWGHERCRSRATKSIFSIVWSWTLHLHVMTQWALTVIYREPDLVKTTPSTVLNKSSQKRFFCDLFWCCMTQTDLLTPNVDLSCPWPVDHLCQFALPLLLVCISWATTGQPRNSVFIRTV